MGDLIQNSNFLNVI